VGVLAAVGSAVAAPCPTLAEDVLLGSSGCSAGSLTLSDLTVEAFAGPTPTQNVFFELGIDGGTAGSATLGPTLATPMLDDAATPIPEPSAAALSVIGLLALLAHRRWRGRKRL
jgi:hypothetical protein